ncbi:MAG TPA: tRNA (adenosine(37)-N6)-threonylcarbamoyltransferase complex dimerization subunit type 1 TsaB [Candidatus Acidoferrales bacterium]|nr:tRNA (adenosine(37)-N6)-threonylcarbamoyltransferase complex dimerization subunit type 1 TsaB [Candidatus Acidoferrales bacterium]
MLLLAVDTATATGSLAVLRDGALLGLVSSNVSEGHSTRLFRHVDFLLAELQLKMEQFDVFAVAAGPGSFTGLRVGLTAVKAWAEVYAKPVVPLNGLEAVAAQASRCGHWKENGQNDDELLVAPVVRATRGQVCGALYNCRGSELKAVDRGQACSAEEFLAYIADHAKNRRVQFISPEPEVIQSALVRSKFFSAAVGHGVLKASPVLAPILGELAFQYASRGEFTDALRLDANYIQRSDAELAWKG